MTTQRQDDKLIKDISTLKRDIADVKQSIALNNQFNAEVVKPFIVEYKQKLSDIPTQAQIRDIKEELDEKVTRREVGIAGAIITALLAVLSFIFNYHK